MKPFRRPRITRFETFLFQPATFDHMTLAIGYREDQHSQPAAFKEKLVSVTHGRLAHKTTLSLVFFKDTF